MTLLSFFLLCIFYKNIFYYFSLLKYCKNGNINIVNNSVIIGGDGEINVSFIDKKR